MADVGTAPSGAQERELDPQRWIALAVILVAAFMDMLDSTILNVTVPAIEADLDASYAELQWITAGYQIAFALLLILGGRLGDIFGRKRIFQLGVAGFTLTSLGCGLANTPEMLIVFRILEGGFAAVMVPQVLAIVHVSFPPKERAQAFGLFGMVAGLAAISGLSLGGLLVQWDLFGLDWRLVFLINIPVGVIGFIVGQAVIRESKAPQATRIDFLGTIVLAGALFLLLYPLVQGREQHWPTWSFVMLAASPVALVLFVLHQQARLRADRSPLVVLPLFRLRSFSSALSVQLAFNIGVGIFFLSWTLYLQLGLGWSPLHAGLTSLPYCIATFITSALSYALLAAKLGRKLLQIGAILVVTGIGSYIWVVNQWGSDVNTWQMALPLAIFGAGFGMIMAPIPDIATSEAPLKDAGAASGVVNTNQQLGFAIGTALVSVIFFGALSGAAADNAREESAGLTRALTSASVSEADAASVVSYFETCTQTQADNEAWSVPLTALCQNPPAALDNPEVAAALADASAEGKANTFIESFTRSMWWLVGLVVLAFLLMFTLPRKNAALEHSEGDDEGDGSSVEGGETVAAASGAERSQPATTLNREDGSRGVGKPAESGGIA